LLMERPSGFIKSSRRTSPGWTGGIRLSTLLMVTSPEWILRATSHVNRWKTHDLPRPRLPTRRSREAGVVSRTVRCSRPGPASVTYPKSCDFGHPFSPPKYGREIKDLRRGWIGFWANGSSSPLPPSRRPARTMIAIGTGYQTVLIYITACHVRGPYAVELGARRDIHEICRIRALRPVCGDRYACPRT